MRLKKAQLNNDYSSFNNAPSNHDKRIPNKGFYIGKMAQVNSEFIFNHPDMKKKTKGYDKMTGEIKKRGKPRSGLTNAQIDAALDNYFIPAKELSDSEGSFADRFANEYGGNINDYFDFEAMAQIYNFFDQDIPLGHTPSTIRRYYNGDITTLPALRQSDSGS